MFTSFIEASLNMKAPIGVEVKWIRGRGWCPSRRHIDSMEKAIEWGADLICFVGADQIHPEDMFQRLVDRYNEGYKIISAMVPIRGHVVGQDSKPFQPMAWRLKKDSKTEFEAIDPEDGAVQKIDVIGSGVFMFPTEILKRLKKPWFKEDIDMETYNRKFSGDSDFVWRLGRELGEQVYTDTTIKVKHTHVFDIDETFQERFKDYR